MTQGKVRYMLAPQDEHQRPGDGRLPQRSMRVNCLGPQGALNSHTSFDRVAGFPESVKGNSGFLHGILESLDGEVS